MTLYSLPWYTFAMFIIIWMLDKATEDMTFRQKRNKNSTEFVPEIHPVVPTPNVNFWQDVNDEFK